MPTNDELAAAIARVLGAILDHRPDLREPVAVIARWISEVAAAPAGDRRALAGTKQSKEQTTEGGAESSVSDGPGAVGPGERPADARRGMAPTPPLPEAYVPLNIGGSTVQVKVSGTSVDIGRARLAAFEASSLVPEDRGEYADLDEPDLELVVRRCELKVRACEAAKSLKHAPLDRQFELRGTIIHDLVPEAKNLPNCFLWMTMPDKPYPGDLAIGLCRDAYANAAAAARLLLQAAEQDRPTAVQHALDLAAEAQSALRVALKATWLTRDDFDQYDLFIWVRRFAERNRYYIERHLRVDDPADPTNGASLAARLREALEAARDVSEQAGRIKTSLSKARYHAKQIADNPGETRQTDWVKAMEALGAARSAGAHAGDSRVREVANLVGGLTPPEGVRLDPFLERARADQPPAEEPDDPGEGDAAPQRTFSATVQRVAAVLRGKRLVVSGGEDRPHQRRQLVDAFELSDVEWVTIKEHGSAVPLERPIRDPETFMVLSLVRLSSHSHVDAAREYARAYGKHYVMIPAGFSPEQVAEQIVTQRGIALGLIDPAA